MTKLKLAWSVILGLALTQAAARAVDTGSESNWLTDLSKAETQAKEQHKLVLMDFTGSDWCPPCQALHSQVLTTKDFQEYAKKNLVLVQVDFPHHRALPAEQQKANDQLADKFNINGFPTVIVLDPTGKELNREEGYGGEGPKEFVAKLEKLKSKS